VTSEAIKDCATIPTTLDAFWSLLSALERRRLMIELKMNSLEFATTDNDAVDPGGRPMRFVTIFANTEKCAATATQLQLTIKDQFNEVAVEPWNEDGIRVITDRRGIALGEFKFYRSAIDEIGGTGPEFWKNYHLLVDDQSLILRHRPETLTDLPAAKELFSIGRALNLLVKAGAHGYATATASLGAEMGLLPGEMLGASAESAMSFLTCNSKARESVRRAVDLTKREQGFDALVSTFKGAHEHAEEFVPQSFVSEFRAHIEWALSELPVNHLESLRRRNNGTNGASNGNGELQASGS
jgi:hypothetical protein